MRPVSLHGHTPQLEEEGAEVAGMELGTGRGGVRAEDDEAVPGVVRQASVAAPDPTPVEGDHVERVAQAGLLLRQGESGPCCHQGVGGVEEQLRRTYPGLRWISTMRAKSGA